MAPPKKVKDTKPARKRADKSTVIDSVIKAGSAAAAIPDEKPKTARRGRKPASVKPEIAAALAEPKRRAKSAENGKPPAPAKKSGRPKGKAFLPEDPLLNDHLTPEDEEDVITDPDELDPVGIPLELLDPELRDASKSAAAQKVKPRQSKVERRMVKCAHCGGSFTWLSVERLCFTCVKRKLAQRKRDDESYGGVAEVSDDDDDNS